jgi:hypothetical protein
VLHQDNGAAHCGCTQRNEFPRSQLTAYKDQRRAITAIGIGSKPRLRKPDSVEALIDQRITEDTGPDGDGCEEQCHLGWAPCSLIEVH